MLFYQNVVWLDMMYLFPLLLLSLNYLAKTGRFLPYLLCLSGMITVHFYLSYMLLAFLVLCSCLWVFFSIKEPVCGQRVVSLGLGTMGAGLLTAVVWLPSLIEYLGSARGANLFDSLAAGNFLTRNRGYYRDAPPLYGLSTSRFSTPDLPHSVGNGARYSIRRLYCFPFCFL